MQLTDQQLDIIERCGAALCKTTEVSLLAGIPLELLKKALADPDNEIYQVYHRGLENTKLELKESVIAIARQGSSPAQTLAFGLLKDLEMEQEEGL